MQEVTFSADDSLIERAREVARSEGKTLEAAFQEWLGSYASRWTPEASPDAIREEMRGLFRDLKYVRAGRKFSRDEMNER